MVTALVSETVYPPATLIVASSPAPGTVPVLQSDGSVFQLPLTPLFQLTVAIMLPPSPSQRDQHAVPALTIVIASLPPTRPSLANAPPTAGDNRQAAASRGGATRERHRRARR